MGERQAPCEHCHSKAGGPPLYKSGNWSRRNPVRICLWALLQFFPQGSWLELLPWLMTMMWPGICKRLEKIPVHSKYLPVFKKTSVFYRMFVGLMSVGRIFLQSLTWFIFSKTCICGSSNVSPLSFPSSFILGIQFLLCFCDCIWENILAPPLQCDSYVMSLLKDVYPWLTLFSPLMVNVFSSLSHEMQGNMWFLADNIHWIHLTLPWE